MAETAAAVANYFINKALEENRELTSMQLIKLVYLAHGWHLGLSGEPLISEQIQTLWREATRWSRFDPQCLVA